MKVFLKPTVLYFSVLLKAVMVEKNTENNNEFGECTFNL